MNLKREGDVGLAGEWETIDLKFKLAGGAAFGLGTRNGEFISRRQWSCRYLSSGPTLGRSVAPSTSSDERN